MSSDWVGQVLSYWFGELTPKAWFERSEMIDRTIRDRFMPIHGHVSELADPQAGLDELLADPEVALAAIVVLDQFSRNMFRGTAQAFASDAKALVLADRAVDVGLDQRVDAARRLFFYLPFEHSERMADQDRSVALFERLGDANYLHYAHAHRDIVGRFGRFPHRNEVLGRTSTPEELAFLETSGSSF
jgi:uncharacterized protein (DUF924 family)